MANHIKQLSEERSLEFDETIAGIATMYVDELFDVMDSVFPDEGEPIDTELYALIANCSAKLSTAISIELAHRLND